MRVCVCTHRIRSHVRRNALITSQFASDFAIHSDLVACLEKKKKNYVDDRDDDDDNRGGDGGYSLGDVDCFAFSFRILALSRNKFLRIAFVLYFTYNNAVHYED